MLTHELSGMHLIDGKWIRSESGETYQAVNPASGATLVPNFAKAAAPEVNAALSLAMKTFERTSDLPSRWMANLLDTIADRIMDLGDTLMERGEQETGLPRARLTGERARTTGQLKMFANVIRDGSWVDAVIDHADPKRTPAAKPDVRRMLRPRGPVAVFGASNFPFAFGVCGGDTASALAAGCPVVVKGHPSHPGTNELFAAAVKSALEQTKLPFGLFGMLQGKSHELGAMLVKHPATQAVGFTGSRTAGRALFDMAAAREKPIPVYAEMGSLNPLIILPAALAERGEQIAQGLAGSVLLGAGQFCTKPGLIFVIGDDRGFGASLAKHVSAAAPFTMLNKGLRDAFADRVASFASVSGVKTLVKAQSQGHAAMTAGLFETTSDVWLKDKELHEEAFGPATMIIRCQRIEQAIECINLLGGTLTGTLHVGQNEDKALAKRALHGLEALSGRVIVNGYPTGVEVCHAIVHGGPYPATTDPGSTSVGTGAIRRFVRMVAFQDTPQELLPDELKDENPLRIERVVDGKRVAGE